MKKGILQRSLESQDGFLFGFDAKQKHSPATTPEISKETPEVKDEVKESPANSPSGQSSMIRRDYNYKKHSPTIISPKIPTNTLSPSIRTPSNPSSAKNSSAQKSRKTRSSGAIQKCETNYNIFQENVAESDKSKSSPVCERVDYVKNKPEPVSSFYNPSADVSIIYQKRILHDTSSSASKRICSSTSSSIAMDASGCTIKVERDETTESSQSSSTIESSDKSNNNSSIKIEEPVVESESQQNVNNISNNINIILTLGKDLIKRKNKSPKKSRGQNSRKEPDNVTETPITDLISKSFKSSETQTECQEKEPSFNEKPCRTITASNPLQLDDGEVEKFYFENNSLIIVQEKLVSFFEYENLKVLLSGKASFTLIDRLERKRYDEEADKENSQRLCFNQSTIPIYVEMRGRQKKLEDEALMCPNASMYCQIYYIDNKQMKCSAVHLDTVKSLIADIKYTTIPNSCYFLISWNEKLENTGYRTGLCKYNLTPNLSLAKLASIRQFPALSYKVNRLNCMENNNKAVAFGETQMSIFNYETGDLLISLDLVQHFGTNLTTFEIGRNYLFMARISDTFEENQKLLKIIGVCRSDANNFKIIHQKMIPLANFNNVTSRTITSTNHLIVTFDNTQTLLLNLENFDEICVGRRQEQDDDSNKRRIFVCHDKIFVTSEQNWEIYNFVNYFH